MTYDKCIMLIAAPSAVLVAPGEADAQDVEARLYANAPKGTNFVAVAYKYSHGEIVVNSSIIKDLRGDLHTAGLGYLRVFSLAGMTAKFDLLVPYTWMDASAEVSGRDTRIGGDFDNFALNYLYNS